MSKNRYPFFFTFPCPNPLKVPKILHMSWQKSNKKQTKNKTGKRQNQREASFDIVLHCRKKKVLGGKKKWKATDGTSSMILKHNSGKFKKLFKQRNQNWHSQIFMTREEKKSWKKKKKRKRQNHDLFYFLYRLAFSKQKGFEKKKNMKRNRWTFSIM